MTLYIYVVTLVLELYHVTLVIHSVEYYLHLKRNSRTKFIPKKKLKISAKFNYNLLIL